MEAFDVGTHVLIELMDTTGEGVGRTIAGYLHGSNESGVFIKATHKDVPAIHMVSDELREDTRAKIGGVGFLARKLECLKRGEYPALLKGKKWTVDYLTDLTCEDLVDEARAAKRFTFYEYKVPVLTYVSADTIALMEASDDVSDDIDVRVSSAGLDAELPDLLDGKIPPRVSDEKVMDEVDEKEEQAELGDEG